MKDMVLVSFVVDLLLALLLLFLFVLQRRDRHALFWGLGHLCLSLLILFWYLPANLLPLPSLRDELMTLLAFAGWCGYWFGSRWAVSYQLTAWRRELLLFGVLALLMRLSVEVGDPFVSVVSVTALLHYFVMTVIFAASGYWLWQRLPDFRLLAVIFWFRSLMTVVMPFAVEFQLQVSLVMALASLAKISCLLGIIYLLLVQSKRRYSAIIDSLSHGFFVRDKAGTIVRANDKGAVLLGFASRADIEGQSVTRVLPRLTQAMADAFFARLTTPGGKAPFIDEAVVELCNGNYLEAEFISSPYHEYGQLYCLVQLLDISERKTQQRELLKAAAADRITGLMNRNALADELDKLLQQQRPQALLLLDIDHFKRINDNFGPQLGDSLLHKVAERLQARFEPLPLARFSGDEFALLWPLQHGIAPNEQLQQPLAALRELFAEVFVLNDLQVLLSCSVGISLAPQDGNNSDTLIKQADIAMYSAKQQGRHSFAYFSAPMLERSKQLLLLDNALKQAISRNELSLHYQPIISSGKTGFRKMEALLRWHSPELGPVSPDRFIPVAEDSGYIVELGDWVLQQGCAQLAQWQQQHKRLLTLSVNISALQLDQANFVTRLQQLLLQYQLQPCQLELEITERVLLDDSGESRLVMTQLAELGVLISLDDFGTGYSSLSYLSRFALHSLKIDRSFVQAMFDGERHEHLVRAIVAMAQSLQLKLVAEGVETKAQAEFLQQLGCHYMQGFYFAKPLSADDISLRLAQTDAGKPDYNVW
ncbi:bifunctional diguanylate cyclase/phosphodiesterase [Rheinheimera sp.]|uniref:putative bifunctional diguanylate cyclase/phosphodiesterase n=1 Tax=Rheinheimera sp. TaxID=1869214 RepID=UPI0027BAAF89|nr:EAL domain-containing protein [Rheinheimera sp.]